MAEKPPPRSVLIIGSGAFGLSTALALSGRPRYAHTEITLLDRSTFPAPDSSSIDTSRIIRADYSDSAYARLAAEAQTLWRGDWGREGRYEESGLVLTADKGGEGYVRKSYENVKVMKDGGEKVRELRSREEIQGLLSGNGGGASGNWGYVNLGSGWADAEASMRYAKERVVEKARVRFRTGTAETLLFENEDVKGVRLSSGEELRADLTILATGAWTPRLIDLGGRAHATGQVLAYMDITEEEQARLGRQPVCLNMSTGMFIIPPRNRLLKVARHGFGYSNPQRVPHPEKVGEYIETSTPRTQMDDPSQWIPREGEDACRRCIAEMIPELRQRPFSSTRICWYTDTPTANFLITYHPAYSSLFLATGGSGHGFKFLPVIGEKIVDAVEGRTSPDFQERWAWPSTTVDGVVTEDGSRGGRKGLILADEMKKGSRL
ncbi:MAG: hypothetical protein M4579_000589 [Chaenotheca gracillima]|nr:MAG: hypothetical protein M4579_000589 [Chaenotheca gracillima]